MAREHTYAALITWTGNQGEGTTTYKAYTRDYEVACAGKPPIMGSADPAYLGDAGRHNPEDLLVAALSACHMLWYLHLCAAGKVVVTPMRIPPRASCVPIQTARVSSRA